MTPEYIDPWVAVPLAVILWAIVIVQYRKDRRG